MYGYPQNGGAGIERENAYGRRGVAQLVARLLWEQDAGSSSLPTPTIFENRRGQGKACGGFCCLIKLFVNLPTGQGEGRNNLRAQNRLWAVPEPF